MNEAERVELESKVRGLCGAGDHDGAATAAIRGYGREVFGFLLAMQRSEEDASDIFSIWTESLWKGLPKFAWECTLRTWAYTIARHAAYRYKKNARRRGDGHVALDGSSSSSGSVVANLAQQIRTDTREWLKTEQKDRFASLRATLPEEDQTLLILRVDRGLAWEELARIMLAEGAEPSPEEIKKESARLRKRFQLVKEKLVELGRKAGLIPSKD